MDIVSLFKQKLVDVHPEIAVSAGVEKSAAIVPLF